MPCTPWQSMHMATFGSPLASCCPCMLVRYSLTTSTRADGLNFFMYAAEEWQRPQNSGIFARSGLPTYGLGLYDESIAETMSSASFGSGLPPWQSWHDSPIFAWTSSAYVFTFAFAVASNMSELWQAMQEVLAGGAANAFAAATPSRTAMA